MMKSWNLTPITGALAGLTLLAHTTIALGAPIVHTQSTDPIQMVPDVAGFMTTGNDMGGMLVTAFFTSDAPETAPWIPGGGVTGAANGANWSLEQTGDTYNAPWILQYTGGSGLLTGFRIDGFGLNDPGERAVMFDRTLDGGGGLVGTPGSAKGRDLEEVVPLPFGVHVRYVGAVDVTSDPGPAREDEFRWLNVNFVDIPDDPDEMGPSLTTPVGLDGDNLRVFEFRQDTNNVVIPEPMSAAIASGALVSVLWTLPRRRRAV